MHDDQHGTAIVVLAALRNAALLTGRPFGCSGRHFRSRRGWCRVREDLAGCRARRYYDRRLAREIHSGRSDLSEAKRELASMTNIAGMTGGLADALRGADVFIGVSAGTVPEDVVATMAPNAIVFALATRAGDRPADRHALCRVVATGRSDHPNQINNVLAFPGVFRGAFDAGATAITEPMKLAARMRSPRSSPMSCVPITWCPAVRRPGRTRGRGAVAAAAGERALLTLDPDWLFPFPSDPSESESAFPRRS